MGSCSEMLIVNVLFTELIKSIFLKVNILYIVLIVNINLKYVSGFYIMYKRIWAIMAKKLPTI